MHGLFPGELVYVLGTSPGAQLVKNPSANAEDTRRGFNSRVGRSPGGGNGDPFQYAWLENSMDRGAWRATVHGVIKSQTRLNMHAQKFCPCLSPSLPLHTSVSLSICWCVSTWIPFFPCICPPHSTVVISLLFHFPNDSKFLFWGEGVGNLGLCEWVKS